MKIEHAIKEYLLEIEIRKFTPKTIKSYRNNLSLFLRYCEEVAKVEDTEELTLTLIKHFTHYMVSKNLKGTYINGLLKVAKAFIQYCYDEENGGFNTKQNFKWCKEDKPIIKAFKPEDVKTIMKSCKGNDFISVRDQAILTTLFETGIRCYELCCIRKCDIHSDFIVINGKNHKQRVVPITAVLRKALLRYDLTAENYFSLKNTDDYYFLSFHGHQLNNSAVERVLRKHGEGIKGIRVSPHTCRHFFAQQQVKMGTDLYTISRLLGHENIAITQTYLNSLRDEDIIKIAKQNSVLSNI